MVGSENRISPGGIFWMFSFRRFKRSSPAFTYSARVTGTADTTSHSCPWMLRVVCASKLSGSCSGRLSVPANVVPVAASTKATCTLFLLQNIKPSARPAR